ncbi:site-2 protease family protein [Sphingomonas bacterium]|uniref:site-2 protease family protein n=1 Tax=Sphingomonas bacterium TaxID=1895847 RepID=UPI00260E4907|nr:site-2 protease family protein [Sphingomonas bacterium]MDB5679707.1 site-2 protease family protein [Sphingomonas bacterium]
MSPNDTIYQIAIWLIPLVIAIVFHEVAHGYVARLFGDHTAERLGRLTLNPIRHVDPVGTLVVPMVLALAHAPIFGWAKPVPVVAGRMRNPRRDMALVALAGPASNFVMATIAALVIGIVVSWNGGALPTGGVAGFVSDNLVNFLLINVFLAIFNLLPVPPFDGGHVVEALLPRPLATEYAKLHRFAFPVMLFLLVVLPTIAPSANIVARVVGPIYYAIVRGLDFSGTLT